MPLLHAIILGIIQGLTEFLPVSSSAHLALIPQRLTWVLQDDFGQAALDPFAGSVLKQFSSLSSPPTVSAFGFHPGLCSARSVI